MGRDRYLREIVCERGYATHMHSRAAEIASTWWVHTLGEGPMVEQNIIGVWWSSGGKKRLHKGQKFKEEKDKHLPATLWSSLTSRSLAILDFFLPLLWHPLFLLHLLIPLPFWCFFNSSSFYCNIINPSGTHSFLPWFYLYWGLIPPLILLLFYSSGISFICFKLLMLKHHTDIVKILKWSQYFWEFIHMIDLD